MILIFQPRIMQIVYVGRSENNKKADAPETPAPPLEVQGAPPLNTSFETKMVKFGLFLGPSDQNKL